MTDSLRICVLANARSAHTQRWARAYAERGHSVHVLSIRREEIPGVEVHTVAVGRENATGVVASFLSYLRLVMSARRRLNRIQPDVVHAHYSITHGVIAAVAGVEPVVVSVWGTDVALAGRHPSGWVATLLNRYALRRAARVTSTSEFMLPTIARLAGRRVPVVRIPFGVDLTQFTPRPVPHSGERLVIGFMKHLKQKYGPQDLLEAIALLAPDHPELRLVLGGEGELRTALSERARELAISDRVEFLGRVAQADVAEVLREFDVLVNPTVVAESFGVVVIEASASGIPVVATDVGGVPEVAREGVNALLVPPANPAELANALARLADDPDLRARLGKAGRRFVEDNYDWTDNVDAMLEVLHTCVEERL